MMKASSWWICVITAGFTVLFGPLASAGGNGAGYITAGLGPEAVLERITTSPPLQVIDLRQPWEYKIGHIPGAINIPVTELEQHLEEIHRDEDVLIYCLNGTRTHRAEPILIEADFSNIYHLNGTFNAWIAAGLPIEK